MCHWVRNGTSYHVNNLHGLAQHKRITTVVERRIKECCQPRLGRTAIDDRAGNAALGVLAYQLLHVLRTTALTGLWRRAPPDRATAVAVTSPTARSRRAPYAPPSRQHPQPARPNTPSTPPQRPRNGSSRPATPTPTAPPCQRPHSAPRLQDPGLYLHDFQTLEEARQVIGEFIEAYNREWLIERHGHRTPAAVRQALTKKAA